MARIGAVFRLLLVVATTVVVTEWVNAHWGPITRASLGDAIGPEGEPGHDDAVTESEFEKYLRVLEAMQANHDLSIEQAVRGEKLALDGFRDLEMRIQRDSSLVERARTTLREKAELLWKERGEPLAGRG